MSLEPGTRLGRYEIRSQIGEGGMGEVYLALDTQLDREVALKTLAPEVAADQQRLQRFLQEARAASKLKGAHAAHIYDVGEASGTYFIAMEYAEGQTLAQLIAARALDVRETVRLGSQIAEALEEAHARGVTHRDIKPSNVIVTPRGQAKVLDFGLAKLSDVGDAAASEAATRVKTNPNAVMGTISYMSPEQALGRADIDQRTDIFSLGIVLYEMLAGRLPFEGESVTAIIDSIVHAQPAAIARFNYDVPPELEVIVKKALRKNADERYQTARDLLTDLRSLERELSLTDAHAHTVASDSRTATFATRAGESSAGASHSANEQATAVLTQTQATRTAPQRATETEATRSTVSSAEYVAGRIKSHKFAVAVFLLIVALSVAGGAFAVYRFGGRGKTQTSAGPMKVMRLTSTGKATRAAISPDGKLVVHVKSEGGQESLWLRQVATTSDTQIVAPSETRYWGLTFSPDANYVYYTTAGGNYNSLASDLYQVPALGGVSRKVLDGVTSPVAFSPDGKRFAFVRYVSKERDESILMLANADGTGEQKLATRTSGSFSPEGLSWSPDGKVIACGAVGFGGVRYWNVVTVNVVDGVEKEITPQRWGYQMGQVAWLADGSGLVMVAREQGSGTRQLWYVSYPQGELRKITNDLNEYFGVSIAADSDTMVTVQSDTTTNVSVAPATDASRIRQVTDGKSEGQDGLSWRPDGRIVYDSKTGDSVNIWVMDQDGKNRRQLTNDAGNSHTPSATPDGRYIIFASGRSLDSGGNIWRMNADGSNPVRLTHGTNEFWVRTSPDSKWAIYTSTDAGKDALWKVPVEGGGERVKLTEKDSRAGSISPDMKAIACLYREEQVDSPFKVALYSFDDGRLLKLLDISQFIDIRAGFRWTADGRALDYIDTRGGISNIWSLPLDGGAAKQLTNFTSDQIFSFDLSRDGKQFAFSRGPVIDDVVLVSNFH
ncbi:MAG: eukaryotic-like serine/threonine-protein kinase [Acidobacteriota bacterium]|nr:eukaryotic-like serine/threonine-protein kinase [Acidobacteriota bacterium]